MKTLTLYLYSALTGKCQQLLGEHVFLLAPATLVITRLTTRFSICARHSRTTQSVGAAFVRGLRTWAFWNGLQCKGRIGVADNKANVVALARIRNSISVLSLKHVWQSCCGIHPVCSGRSLQPLRSLHQPRASISTMSSANVFRIAGYRNRSKNTNDSHRNHHLDQRKPPLQHRLTFGSHSVPLGHFNWRQLGRSDCSGIRSMRSTPLRRHLPSLQVLTSSIMFSDEAICE